MAKGQNSGKNMKNNKKIIGLIGGMGPFASARFLQILLEKSVSDFGAKNGSDFPEIILDSVPIDDFISDTSTLPAARKTLISRVKKLEKMGCTSIAMVCNTGHILFPELSRVGNGKMVSIIDSVRDKVIDRKMKRVGLLATKTTIKAGVFEKPFEGTGIKLINPDSRTLDLCEKAIRTVIANGSLKKMRKSLNDQVKKFIKNEGLDGIILGCTELPLVFPRKPKNFIDCLDVLSDRLLDWQKEPKTIRI